MSTTFSTKQERDAHVLLIRQTSDSLPKQKKPENYQKLKAERDRLYNEYYDRLHVLQFAVCPHCSTPYHHTYDPFGFGGLFWGVMPNKVQTNCEHACLIRSAYICTTAVEPTYYTHADTCLGPEFPYVIRRILKLNTMKAVISKLEFETGDTLYPIVYFATEPPEEFGLTADWDNDEYKACDVPKDTWDFDLRPWVESGHLHWCEHRQGGLVLANKAVEEFPFYGLHGHLGKQFVDSDGDLFRARASPRHKLPEGWKG